MPLGSNEGFEENSVVLGSSEGMGLVAREGKALGIISEFAVGCFVGCMKKRMLELDENGK